MSNQENGSKFGSAKGTEVVFKKLLDIADDNPEKPLEAVDEAIINGDVPYVEPGEYTRADIYEAGKYDGCPVTDHILDVDEIDPTILINAYQARGWAFRLIAEDLKKAGNNKVLDLWISNDARWPGEDRAEYAIPGTPTEILQAGNPHVGAAKYETFSICQLFRRLKDAENNVGEENVPVKELPKNIKLYPRMDVFIEDAKEATGLNDLNERIVSRLIPFMTEKGVTQLQIADLLVNCFMSSSLLLEDNTWERTTKASNSLADRLINSENPDNNEVGLLFKEKIQPRIFALKQ